MPDFPLTGWLPSERIVEASFGTWFEVMGPARRGWLPVAVNYTFAENSPNVSSIGWVLEHHLAAFVPMSDEETVRRLLPQRAEELLGFLYFWGGRSAFNFDMFNTKTQLTGCDCSGLCSISYRSLGEEIIV